jgi:signal transduction histidine kinase
MYLQVDVSDINKAVYVASTLVLVIVLALIFFVVLYRKSHNIYIKEKELMNAQFKQALLQVQTEVQEETYATLGKELHDNIGQLLSSTKMLLAVSERDFEAVPVTFKKAEETLRKAIVELRALSKVFSKDWLLQFDLFKNIEEEIGRINIGRTINIVFARNGETLPNTDVQLIIFRVVQEGIQNIIKHSRASHAMVQIEALPESLTVRISDDGIGIGKTVTKGLGMINMKQRIELINGRISWRGGQESGAIVEITLPIQSTDA